MLSGDGILALPGDRECIEAIAWLARTNKGYPPGLYTPPLERSTKAEGSPKFLAMTCRLRRGVRNGQPRIGRTEWCAGAATETVRSADPSSIAASLAKNVFTNDHAGWYIVTSGQRRHVLDVFLECLGPYLLALGYTLQPCIRPEGIAFIIVRKGKRTWRVVYVEVMLGVSVSTGLAFARPANSSAAHQERLTESLYRATAAVTSWLATRFGVAGRLTLGMTALACARKFLPESMRKWRPTSLLLGMERAAMGYRGGLTYARRYRGQTTRIDVVRQYTHALRSALPARVRFGRYSDGLEQPEGVFMCRVRLDGSVPYPLGVWRGPEMGFEYRQCGYGEYVAVLHTSEFAGLRAIGSEITPWYGYVYVETFNLAPYVAELQRVIDDHGYDSPQSALAKKLGNYVYGKFGQRPDRQEVMYAAERPGDGWHPFFDIDGTDWQDVWERKSVRYTSFQHSDIAGTVTGAARSQTLCMWASLAARGFRVVRCHTDSLTVDRAPDGAMLLSDTVVGGWRVESQDEDATIIGPNAYFDSDGAHIAGVKEPTWEMIDTLYDGSVVTVTQDVNFPRRGWRRGKSSRVMGYRATAG